RVVIDTNVFVSSFQNPEGNPQKIIDLWKRGVFILCISEEIIFEYIEVWRARGVFWPRR
ncbi:MAG: putative toxin-antitoxin system toxin component, PIN family, partial [Nitrospirae bacterium]|nr:putative toxin-antitoxin system toxin component, PIN family [Nitrospirota bacterium]